MTNAGQGEHERAYVEQRWDNARFESCFEASRGWPEEPRVAMPKDRGRILADNIFNGSQWILSGNTNTRFELSHTLSEATAWSAAYAFTIERERQIAEVDAAIAWVKEEKRFLRPLHELQTAKEVYEIPNYILARLEAIRDELKRGMHEQESTER